MSPLGSYFFSFSSIQTEQLSENWNGKSPGDYFTNKGFVMSKDGHSVTDRGTDLHGSRPFWTFCVCPPRALEDRVEHPQ